MTHAFPRMTGTAFNADWFDGISVNTSAAERRASYPFEENTFQRQTGSRLADVLRNFRRE